MPDTCPPCNHDCEQGRRCPARKKMSEGEAREMARDLVRGSIIEDAAAKFIAQILKHAHDERIKPLQARLTAAEAERDTLRAELDKWMERCGRERAFASSHRIRAEAAEAKVEKLVEALKVARAHVANNADGWSVSRAAARVDLKIVDAATTEKPHDRA